MNKKVIITILVTLVGIGGIIAGAFVLRQNTEIREQAAVPGGRATVTFLPVSGNFDVGDSFPVSVYFNTDGVDVSGIAVRVTYPYNGVTPEISATDVEISTNLLASGDWSCPTNNITETDGNVNIDVACANVSAAGFSTTTDTLLAEFNLTVNRAPSVAPFVLSFDPSNSVVTQKTNGQDILALPQSTGSYSIAGSVAAVPTSLPTTPGPTSTFISATPTSAVVATSTPATTSAKVSTGSSTLPEAGFSLPTIIGLGLGILAIFGSLALAL